MSVSGTLPTLKRPTRMERASTRVATGIGGPTSARSLHSSLLPTTSTRYA